MQLVAADAQYDDKATESAALLPQRRLGGGGGRSLCQCICP